MTTLHGVTPPPTQGGTIDGGAPMSSEYPTWANISLVGIDIGDAWSSSGTVDVLVCADIEVGIFVGDTCPTDPSTFDCVGFAGEDSCTDCVTYCPTPGARVRYLSTSSQVFVLIASANAAGNATADVTSFSLSW